MFQLLLFLLFHFYFYMFVKRLKHTGDPTVLFLLDSRLKLTNGLKPINVLLDLFLHTKRGELHIDFVKLRIVSVIVSVLLFKEIYDAAHFNLFKPCPLNFCKLFRQ